MIQLSTSLLSSDTGYSWNPSTMLSRRTAFHRPISQTHASRSTLPRIVEQVLESITQLQSSADPRRQTSWSVWSGRTVVVEDELKHMRAMLTLRYPVEHGTATELGRRHDGVDGVGIGADSRTTCNCGTRSGILRTAAPLESGQLRRESCTKCYQDNSFTAVVPATSEHWIAVQTLTDESISEETPCFTDLTVTGDPAWCEGEIPLTLSTRGQNRVQSHQPSPRQVGFVLGPTVPVRRVATESRSRRK